MNKRVLIVDDDADLLNYLTLIIDSCGSCEIDVAFSGDEAKEGLRARGVRSTRQAILQREIASYNVRGVSLMKEN